MKKFIKAITKSMQGSLLPKRVSEEQIVKEINDSLKKLDYYGRRKEIRPRLGE